MNAADWRAIAAAIVCVCIFASASSLVLPALTLNLEARGETSVTIGALGTLLGLTAILSTPFAPVLVRRLGTGTALCACLFVVAVANLTYKIFFSSLTAWFIIYAVSGAAVGLIFVIAESVITTRAPAARRGLILGMYVAGFSLGFAVGPLILTVTGIDGWAPFIAASGLAVVAAVVVGWARIKSSDIPAAGSNFRHFLMQAPLPFVCAFSLGAVEMAVYDLMPVYARKVGFGINEAIFLLSTFSVGTLILQPVVGALADRLGADRALAASATAAVIGAATLPFLLDNNAFPGDGLWPDAAAGWWRLAALGLWGGFVMAIYPLGLMQMVRVFATNKLVTANALFGFSYGCGALFGPLLTGVAMDISATGIGPVLMVFAALPLLAMLRK